jgi:hypothetical protein
MVLSLLAKDRNAAPVMLSAPKQATARFPGDLELKVEAFQAATLGGLLDPPPGSREFKRF